MLIFNNLLYQSKMSNRVVVRYAKSNVGEWNVTTRYPIEDVVFPLSIKADETGLYNKLQFKFNYPGFGSSPDLTFCLLANEIICSDGMFSIHITSCIREKGRILISGNISHILLESETVDNFQFLFILQEKYLLFDFSKDFQFWHIDE